MHTLRYTRTHTTDQTRAPSTQAQLKGQLLRYVSTAMRFSDLGVDARVVACNRVVLLHGARPAEMARDAPRVAKSAEMPERGRPRCAAPSPLAVTSAGPPGTGKTSLCKALAHKLAVRLGGRYPQARDRSLSRCCTCWSSAWNCCQ